MILLMQEKKTNVFTNMNLKFIPLLIYKLFQFFFKYGNILE